MWSHSLALACTVFVLEFSTVDFGYGKLLTISEDGTDRPGRIVFFGGQLRMGAHKYDLLMNGGHDEVSVIDRYALLYT